ncbi:hypothetical protein WDZ92_29140 [Nostoc sp. NIES-2111]
MQRIEIDVARAQMLFDPLVGLTLSPNSYFVLDTLCLVFESLGNGVSGVDFSPGGRPDYILEAGCQWVVADENSRIVFESWMATSSHSDSAARSAQKVFTGSEFLHPVLLGYGPEIGPTNQQLGQIIVESVEVKMAGQVSLRLNSRRTICLMDNVDGDGEWLLYRAGKVVCTYFAGKGLFERVRALPSL